MNTTNKEIKEKEERLLSFRQEVEGLRDISDAEEYAKQLAHLFLGNGLSLQTILLMAIDFGQQHSHWIPVEEMLPKADGRYIIADKYGGIEQMNFDAESKYWWLRGTGKMSDFVTHWMPLPQLPRKEE